MTETKPIDTDLPRIPPAMATVDHAMQTAADQNVFPGAVLLISKAGCVVFHQAYGWANIRRPVAASLETVFDLASLTKPLATSMAVMQVTQSGAFHLSTRLGEILIECRHTDKADITIEHLLRHRAGLADYRPFYQTLTTYPPNRRQAALRECLVKEPLADPIDKRERYSDLGFMFLRWAVETTTGQRLDRFLNHAVYGPLGLRQISSRGLFFQDLTRPVKLDAVAATEQCAWRKSLMEGRVHDENAYAVGGIEGHAGLFGGAAGVHRLLWLLMETYTHGKHNSIFSPAVVTEYLQPPPDGRRPLGFDIPDVTQSSCGRYFSQQTVGHLGFTGTSFWMDLEASIIVVLLTNRVHPSRQNERIKLFRPQLHDAVMTSLGRNTSRRTGPHSNGQT